jgi:hypothetical protein
MEYHLCSFKSWLEWVCSDWHTLSGSLFAVTILLGMVFGQFHRSAMFDDAANVVRSLWVSNFLKRIWATGCDALLLTSVTGLLDLDGRQKSMLITFSWLLLVSVPFPKWRIRQCRIVQQVHVPMPIIILCPLTAADQRFSSIMYKVEPTWIRNDFFCFKVSFIVTCNIEWVHSMLCPLFICSFSFLAEAKCLFWVSSLKGMDLYYLFFFYIGLKEKQLQRCIICNFYWSWPNISKYGLLNRT